MDREQVPTQNKFRVYFKPHRCTCPFRGAGEFEVKGYRRFKTNCSVPEGGITHQISLIAGHWPVLKQSGAWWPCVPYSH